MTAVEEALSLLRSGRTRDAVRVLESLLDVTPVETPLPVAVHPRCEFVGCGSRAKWKVEQRRNSGEPDTVQMACDSHVSYSLRDGINIVWPIS